MQKVIIMFALVLIHQTSMAQDSINLKNVKLVDMQKTQEQKTKAALAYLIKNKVLICTPEDNDIHFNFENTTTKSILEELNDKGLLIEEFSGQGSICG